MLELFQNASDDQIALAGCAAVFVGSGLLMYFSYFLGPVARQERVRHLDSLIRERRQFLEQNAASSREKAA